MNKLRFSLGIMLMTLIGFSGCTKEGPAGPSGPAGANGNANVIGSNTVALNSSNWVASGSYFYALISYPAITQPIVDKGVVMVYEQNGTSWQALPYTFGILSRSFQISLNTVAVFYQNTDGSQTSNPGNQVFRVVAISSARIASHSHVNFKNFSEVKNAFDLPN